MFMFDGRRHSLCALVGLSPGAATGIQFAPREKPASEAFHETTLAVPPLHSLLAIYAFATFGPCATAASPDVTLGRADYGTTAAGQAVSQYTLANARGVTLKLITYGGIVTTLEVPDRTGKIADIVLGFDSLRDYEAHNGNIHFGALIGRYANRIARGRFTLGGKTWTLPVNDPPNTLHGGPDSFDAKVWTVTGTHSDGNGASVTLRYVSADGENGFPVR